MPRKEELEDYQNYLVQFINTKFFAPYKVDGKEVSRNTYAKKSDVAGSTLSRIKNGEGYDVPISTIYKLCKFENLSIKDFFTEFEDFLEAEIKNCKRSGKE